MECGQFTNMDASALADAHRAQIQGHRRSDMEAQQTPTSTPSLRRSGRRHESKKERRSPTDSRSRSRSPRTPKRDEEATGGITRTLSGLFTSAQEAIGASWAAATAEAPTTSTSDSEADYLSATDSPPTASIVFSHKTGARGNDNRPSTDTRKTYARRRRNSSSSTSASSLEDWQTPTSGPAKQTPVTQMTMFGSTTPTLLMPATTAVTTPRSPGQKVTPPPSPSLAPRSLLLVTSTPVPLMRNSLPPSQTPTLSLSSALKRKLPLPDQQPSSTRSVLFTDMNNTFNERVTSLLSQGNRSGHPPSGPQYCSTKRRSTESPSSWSTRSDTGRQLRRKLS